MSVPAGKILRDRLVAEGIPAFVGPLRPSSQGIPKNAVFVTQQGGLPSQPFLNNEGTRTIQYFDIWIRNITVEAGETICDQVKDILHLGDFDPPVNAVYYNVLPIYTGRDKADGHLWRASYKVDYMDYKT